MYVIGRVAYVPGPRRLVAEPDAAGEAEGHGWAARATSARMRRPPLLALPLVLACAAPAAETTPERDAPQVLADLDVAGRRALCGRIIAARRRACDRSFDDLHAGLIDDCAADHPRWSCATIRIDDHERCEISKDATACAAVHSQGEACRLPAALRARCPLHVGAVAPGGPAARAGVAPGDRVLTINGAVYGHVDLARAIAEISASTGPLRLGVASGEAPARDLEIQPEVREGQARIGVEFTAPPECRAFLSVRGPLPCSLR